MIFLHHAITPLKKYAVFAGRASISEYLSYTLLQIAIFFLLVGTSATVTGSAEPAYVLCALVFFLPNLAVTVRRLHDFNASGWWALVSLVPVASFILCLVVLFRSGTPGENRYGLRDTSQPD